MKLPDHKRRHSKLKPLPPSDLVEWLTMDHGWHAVTIDGNGESRHGISMSLMRTRVAIEDDREGRQHPREPPPGPLPVQLSRPRPCDAQRLISSPIR
jgi:hypothetical protein